MGVFSLSTHSQSEGPLYAALSLIYISLARASEELEASYVVFTVEFVFLLGFI